MPTIFPIVHQTEGMSVYKVLPLLIDGGVAGSAGLTAVFPFDTIVTRLQNQQIKVNPMYNGIIDCFKKIVQQEGVHGLYRGLLVNALLITPEAAIRLSTNDFFRSHLPKNENGNLSLDKQMIAGGLAGTMQLIVTTPMELMKIQMQDYGRTEDVSTNQKRHPIRAIKMIKNVVNQHGILGLYKGFRATALRDVTFSMLYFPLFYLMHENLPECEIHELDIEIYASKELYTHFFAGMFGGSIAAIVVTPFDMIKTRIQTYRKGKGEREFNGIIDCFRITLKYDGPKALFRGGLCRILMLSPQYAITQLVYYIGVGNMICSYFSKGNFE